VADDVVGKDNGFQADVPMFQLVPESSVQVRVCVHIDPAIGVSEGIMAGKSISHHHCKSAWQRTELQRVYAGTGMTETDWETGVYWDTGVAEMDGVMGGIYSGNPGVDSLHRILYLISSHLIIQ